MGPGALLRRPHWDSARRVLVLAGHRPDLLADLLARVRELAPRARVDLRLAFDPPAAAMALAESVASLRLEEREPALAHLRETRFDIVAVLAGHRAAALLLVPLHLDARSVVLFDEGLGWFALNLGCGPRLLRQLGWAPWDTGPIATLSIAAVRLARSFLVGTLAAVWLVGSTTRIRVRGRARQALRALRG